MSVTAARLRTVVTADTGQAQQGLRDFGRTVSTTAREANRDLGGIGDGLRQLPGALGQIGGLLGGAFTVAGAATLLAQGGRLALTLDNQRQIAANVRKELVAYAGGAHEAAAATEALRRATDGGISRLEAMRGASQLLGMGLVQNADQAYTMARMAVMLGDKTLGAQERMASWNAMLANQSIERLDTFGVSSGRVRQRIEEMMAAQAGLDRQTAFTNAVLEIGAEKLRAVEAEGVTAATSIDKVRAAWDDLRAAAAEKINLEEALGGVAGYMSGVADQMTRAQMAQSNEAAVRLEAQKARLQELLDLRDLYSDEATYQMALPNLDRQIAELQKVVSWTEVYGDSADEVAWAVNRLHTASSWLADTEQELAGALADGEAPGIEWATAQRDPAKAALEEAAAALQSAVAVTQMGEDADITRIKLLGLAEANQEVATAAAAAGSPRRFDFDLGLTDQMTRGSTIKPATPVRGSKAWNDQQEADRQRTEYLRSLNKSVAQDAGKSYLDAMTQAGKEAASKINGYLQEGMHFSIGLNDMTQNPLAPGQNGPFEQIYRLQAWLKDGSWGDVAAQAGGERGQIEGLVRSFQMGNFTPDVLKMIDLGGLRKLMQDQVAAEASQQALAGQLGGDASLLKSLLGLDQAGQGIVLSQAESAALAKSLAGSVDTALKENSLGVDLVAALVATMTTELAADGGTALEAQGAAAYDKVGNGFVKRASESPVFYRAVGAMVDSYIARELEQ